MFPGSNVFPVLEDGPKPLTIGHLRLKSRLALARRDC
jgi:hypothetical protein